MESDTIEQTRLCPKCKTEKFASSFYRSAASKSGIGHICKACVLTRSQEKRARNKEINKTIDTHGINIKCITCKEEKGADEFHKDAGLKYGRQTICKPCALKDAKNYYERNKEKCLDRGREWRSKNPDKMKKCVVRWRNSNKEKIREYQKNNRERLNARSKSWRQKNRDHVLILRNKNKEKNIELHILKNRKYREANKESIKESNIKYRIDNPLIYRAAALNRHARIKSTGGKFSPVDIENMFELQKGRCNACSGPLGNYHIDHIMPICRGGSNFPDNLQLLCARCNLSKNAKTMDEFMAIKTFERQRPATVEGSA